MFYFSPTHPHLLYSRMRHAEKKKTPTAPKGCPEIMPGGHEVNPGGPKVGPRFHFGKPFPTKSVSTVLYCNLFCTVKNVARQNK